MTERDNTRRDLRATAGSIRNDAQHLAELEERKMDLDPSDPRVDELSIEVERLVSEISDKAKAERELAASNGGGSPMNERPN